jgi:hypothetical protein
MGRLLFQKLGNFVLILHCKQRRRVSSDQ